VALSEDEKDTFGRLTNKLQRNLRDVKRLDAYYEGTQRLERLGLAVPEELAQFVTMVNWPRVTCDAVEERIDLEGFRLPGDDSPDDDLWAVWQANDLDEESQLAHLDALALRRAFVCVGAGDAGPAQDDDSRDDAIPLVTVESPFEMTMELNPRTRQASAALKAYRDNGVAYGTLYLPNRTIWLESGRTDTRWIEIDRDEHNLGVVPVVPIVNRSRMAQREGVSEMADVISLTDAAARALTNAQVATETLAVPQRYVLGASKGDFVDKDNNQLPAWEAYFGAIWGLRKENAKVGQFSAADLGNFTRIVEHYATLVSGVSGLPMRYFGSNTANPPSADGIRADEARLVKKAERRCRAWGGSWERVMRLVRRIQDGDWDPSLAAMETLWRDPATPTRAQQADATVKLYAAGLLPREGAWEDMGYSATRRKKLAQQFEAQAEDPLMARLLAEAPEPVAVPADAPVS
jgi:hypothetical protein